MAATDAKAFPLPNAAYRVYFAIRSAATGNPITGGLTSLAAQVSKDGAAFAAATNAPVEIGTTGYGYLDLTAGEMNATAIVVRITATNANAIECQTLLLTTAASQIGGAALPGGSSVIGRIC